MLVGRRRAPQPYRSGRGLGVRMEAPDNSPPHLVSALFRADLSGQRWGKSAGGLYSDRRTPQAAGCSAADQLLAIAGCTGGSGISELGEQS